MAISTHMYIHIPPNLIFVQDLNFKPQMAGKFWSISCGLACVGCQTLLSSLPQLYVGQMKVVIMGWHWATIHSLSGSSPWVLHRHKAWSLLDRFRQISDLSFRYKGPQFDFVSCLFHVLSLACFLCRKNLKWNTRPSMADVVAQGFLQFLGDANDQNVGILVSTCYFLSCLQIHFH